MNTTSVKIKSILTEFIAPETIEVLDDSQSHAGHEGVKKSGGGHYYLTIVSEKFADKNRIQRHQYIYQLLGDMMKSEIHALSIKAFTPEEKIKSEEI